MRGRFLSVALGVLAGLVVAPSALAASPLNAYRVKATGENRQALVQAGFDMTEADKGDHFEIIARKGEVAALSRDGVEAKRVTAVSKLAAPGDYTGSDAGFDVYTRYDAVPDDGKQQYVEQYQSVAAANATAKLVALAPQTHLGRTIYAVKVTKDAKTTPDGTRPAVLFNAQQHAREWLAGETCRRTLVIGNADVEALEVTTALAALAIVGPQAREVIARFCALDLRPQSMPVGGFRPGSLARTPGYVLREDDDRFLMLFGWALGEYMWTVVADAAEALGGGPVGVDALEREVARA